MTSTTRLLEASITMETMKKHFFNSLDAVAEFLDKEENRDPDTVEQFLDAVKFAHGLGRKYPTYSLEQWLEQQNPQ